MYIGLDEYPSSVLLPVGIFTDAKVGKSKVKWYNRVAVGYGFSTVTATENESYGGGGFINFETGLWIKTTAKGALTITFGHYRQRSDQTQKGIYRYPAVGDLYQEFSFRRGVINIGYSTRI